jgi:hypothetical protein
MKIIDAQYNECRRKHHEKHQDGKHGKKDRRGILLWARPAGLGLAVSAGITAVVITVAIVTARWRFSPTAADVFDDQLDIVDYRCSRHKWPPLLHGSSLREFSGKRVTRKQAGKNE